MNRRTLDVALPMSYAAVVVATVFLAHNAVAGVAAVGGILLGTYYAVLRKNISQ